MLQQLFTMREGRLLAQLLAAMKTAQNGQQAGWLALVVAGPARHGHGLVHLWHGVIMAIGGIAFACGQAGLGQSRLVSEVQAAGQHRKGYSGQLPTRPVLLWSANCGPLHRAFSGRCLRCG